MKGAMFMVNSQIYDPHLLYHAINITVELKYAVPMKRVYNLLEILSDGKDRKVSITPNEILEVLNKLGTNLEDTILSDEPCDGDSLQSKIKELLRLLGCNLSDVELNKILKGELSLDEALSKTAKIGWLMVFEVDENCKYRPNDQIVEQMLWLSQSIAVESIENKIQKTMQIDNYNIQTDSKV